MTKTTKKEIRKDKMKISKKLYPAEEQGILKEETKEEKTAQMKAGEEDEDVYTAEGRDLLEEDDEISPEEEGFLAGAADLGQLGKDALTGEPLINADNIIEAEIGGKLYRFVSEKNATRFIEKKKKKEK